MALTQALAEGTQWSSLRLAGQPLKFAYIVCPRGELA